MKEIILISDESWLGGASITNASIVEEGLKRNYSVTMYVYGKKELEGKREFNPPNADLYILANYGYIPKDALEKFINEKPFVRFFHDVPGFLQQLASSFFVDAQNTLQLMMDKAKHVFMISPMQYSVVQNRIKLDEKKISIIPPYIPLEKFKNLNLEREDAWFYLGDIAPARGVEKSIQIAIQNGCKKFVLAGPDLLPNYINNLKEHYSKYCELEYLGEIEYEKVPELMNKYKYFIYTPEILDSFCRKIVEAEEAGMEIFADSLRIGLFSFPKEYKLKENILNANNLLWDKLEELINGSTNGPVTPCEKCPCEDCSCEEKCDCVPEEKSD